MKKLVDVNETFCFFYMEIEFTIIGIYLMGLFCKKSGKTTIKYKFKHFFLLFFRSVKYYNFLDYYFLSNIH